MGALIIQRPLSVMVEEGESVTLQCKTSGVPIPTVTWQKAFSRIPKKKTAVKNLESYNTQNRKSRWRVDRLKFTLTPPIKAVTSVSWKLMLHCEAQGAIEVDWIRVGKHLPQNHILYPNSTLLLRNISPNDAGSYTCVAWRHLLSR